MLIRRNLAIALGTVTLATPALTACGFDAATDRPYTPAAGANHVDAGVDVLNAAVVSTSPGSGTFVASLSNNDNREPVSFDELTAGTGGELEVTEFEPIEIPPGGLVNMATSGGVEVSGDFEAGDNVAVVVGFSSGEQATMQVPVVSNDGQWSGLDGEPTASPTDLETADSEG
jgi:hypothetical protein